MSLLRRQSGARHRSGGPAGVSVTGPERLLRSSGLLGQLYSANIYRTINGFDGIDGYFLAGV